MSSHSVQVRYRPVARHAIACHPRHVACTTSEQGGAPATIPQPPPEGEIPVPREPGGHIPPEGPIPDPPEAPPGREPGDNPDVETDLSNLSKGSNVALDLGPVAEISSVSTATEDMFLPRRWPEHA